MYLTFIGSAICIFFLSYPATDYSIHGINGPINFTLEIGLVPFVLLTVALGFFMSLGKAAVYKHIPVYYPDHVGSVGGLVGMIGGLGGFTLPICFGLMNDMIGVWTSCFMLLFVIVMVSLIWMHISVVLSNRRLCPELSYSTDLPEVLDPKPTQLTP
jgi:NNP family nitrate/nitrite transporter-like MFS transporter